jgi:hypothetical protein
MTNRKATKKSAPDGNAAGGSLQPAASPAPSGTASAPGEAADDGSSAAAVRAAAAHPGDQLSAAVFDAPLRGLEPAQVVLGTDGTIVGVTTATDATSEPAPSDQLFAGITVIPSALEVAGQVVFGTESVLDAVKAIAEAAIEPISPESWLKVIGPKTGRWRAGRHFGPIAAFVPIEELTPEQISAIEGDPQLLCTVVSDPDERG